MKTTHPPAPQPAPKDPDLAEQARPWHPVAGPRTPRIAALIVIAAGVVALVYGGFSYTTENTAAKLGPLDPKVKEENQVNIPVWVDVAAVVSGGLVLLGSARK